MFATGRLSTAGPPISFAMSDCHRWNPRRAGRSPHPPVPRNGPSSPDRERLRVEPVALALRPAQHRVGRVVADEALGRRVPVQPPAGVHRDMVQQAGRAGAVADLGGRDGGFAAPDAVEPVPVLVVALVEMDFVRADDAVEDFGSLASSGSTFGLAPWSVGVVISSRVTKIQPSVPIELDAVGKVARDDPW